MKKLILAVFASIVLASMSFSKIENSTEIVSVNKSDKLDIKIKNDTSDVVKVINAGSGGSYSLSKGTTTSIKMEEGDKLHYYANGKKGDLILTASKEMDGKVQLLSKL
ncbi:hypothetical protein [Frigoriflavimonas asaccharolytica]|uniref:Uncharacterized protein n=1 Tax=Frigoriflavimonas asaccharolytica TaxID=2735899 RepID=A0A8J8G8L1_9FLAO|nr:hypothetical protein [Frigoriflavimonas asaccharolytica]NRS91285.1 hypothetical protein [Frigoriflavimonas asaccharolytica]